MKFHLIVAIDSDSLIGVREYGEYSLPWPKIKEDVDFFHTTVMDGRNVIIVGMNTWRTLPPKYKTTLICVIIHRNKDTVVTDNEVYVTSFTRALEHIATLTNINQVYAIGGWSVYNEALLHPSLDKLYITHISHHYPITNEVEQKIYFPLTRLQLNVCCQNALLTVTTSPVSHSISNNIDYYFATYHTTQTFSDYYKTTTKLKPHNFYKMLPYDDEDMEQVELIKQVMEEYKIPQPKPIKVITGEMQYVTLVKTIIETGNPKPSRNGLTRSVFGYQMRYNLSEGFPLLTVKRSYPKSIFEELMWFISGSTNVKRLQERGVHIWDKNSSKEFLERNYLPYNEGDIGPSYGFQMRHYGATYFNCMTDYTGYGVDQLANCINYLKFDPYSRRIIIDLWNCGDIGRMALPPCALLYHFEVDRFRNLNCHLFQRSWDVMLGWNTTTAALLTCLLAHHCGLRAGVLVHSVSDAHIYSQHLDAAMKLITRKPRVMPKLTIIKKHENIEDYVYEDIVIENYYPCPAIKVDMVE